MNKDEMIEYYISLVDDDLFTEGLLTKDNVRKRLRKLTINEIEWEIKSTEKLIQATSGWD